MSFVVVYDACVLYPSTLRDLLIRIHQAGLVQAKWSDEILDEMASALRRNLPDIGEEKLERLRGLMVKAVRDCRVTNYEPLIDAVELPDPKDRHVLAAAIRARAQVIVTDNSRDVPADCTGPMCRARGRGSAEHQRPRTAAGCRGTSRRGRVSPCSAPPR